MKKLFLILALAIFTIGVNAQEKTPIDADKMEQKQVEKYQCSKCDYFDTKAGKCPTHYIDLVKEGTYCCASCNMSCELACKCPKCGLQMVQMECKKPQDPKIKRIDPKK